MLLLAAHTRCSMPESGSTAADGLLTIEYAPGDRRMSTGGDHRWPSQPE
ncbi:MAG: hypothetical protein QXU79_01030 [Candidatus Micrarchaeaceae archaeon]